MSTARVARRRLVSIESTALRKASTLRGGWRGGGGLESVGQMEDDADE